MAALDSAVSPHPHIRPNLSAALIVGGAVGGCCAAWVPLHLMGATYQGWSLAARTTDEFAGLLLLIAFLASPLASLFPTRFTAERQGDHRRLALGFAAAYGVYLYAAISAATADGQKLGAPQMFSVAFQYGVLIIMVATSDIWPQAVMGRAVWRRIHTAALWFFWLIYTFAYVGHFMGPHIPDASYGVGLIFLIQALFIRHAAALKNIWVRPVAGKVG